MLFKKNAEKTQLDQTIEQLERELQMTVGDPKETAKMVKNLERLYDVKSKHAPKSWNRDTLLIVGGNLLGILIIVAYEHSHVITSKAVNQIGKIR